MTAPASDGGVLTAGVGQQISLTCSHDNDAAGTTLWKISSPVGCTAVITHITATSSGDCSPFSFEDVSQGLTPPFNSTAVATATTSMSGAVVQCFDSAAAAAVQVGSNITLCVYGEPSQYDESNFSSCSCVRGGVRESIADDVIIKLLCIL